MDGAKASRHFNMCSVCQALQQIIAVWRVAHTISAPHHACACRPHIHAYLLPSSSLGPHSRRPSLASAVQHVTTCRVSGSGALRRLAFSFLDSSRLFRAAVASLLPWSARTHPDQLEPWSARTHHLPLRRLAPASRSAGLSPTLSLPFSLALPFSFSPVAPLCSFPTVLYPLSLSLSLSVCLSPSLSRPLSRAQKRGVRVVRCIPIPPGVRTILHATEEVWCIHWATTMGYLHHDTMRSILLLLFVTPCHAYLLSHGGVFSSV